MARPAAIPNIIVSPFPKDQAAFLGRVAPSPGHLCSTSADAMSNRSVILGLDKPIDLLVREDFQMFINAFTDWNSAGLRDDLLIGHCLSRTPVVREIPN
ncbi:MAG: hypothetical protein WBB64_00530 [Anaerolineales bacterium]